MICNGSLTVYHKSIDAYHNEVWTSHSYDNVWFFGSESASTNKGYDNANSVEVRIPYALNSGLNINDFNIGDILVQGTLTSNITTQQDLSGYVIYNITSIKNNNFGSQPHIHLGGI